MMSKDRLQPEENNSDPIMPLTKLSSKKAVGQHHKRHIHRHEDANQFHEVEEYDRQEDIQTYLDLQMLNPDWKFAAKHADATRPGMMTEDHEKQECICCFKQINKIPLPLCENSKQLQFLGFGFPLYFIFMKFAMFILLVEIVNYTAIQLYFAIKNNYDFCVNDIARVVHGHTVHCTSFMVLLATIDLHVTTEQHILRVSSFFTLMIFVIYLRDHFTKTWKYYDERQPNYGDYSLFLINLPTKKILEGKTKIGQLLREFFGNQTLFPHKPRIAKLNLIGQFTNLHRLETERKQLMHQLEKLTHKNKELETKIKDDEHGGSKEEDIGSIKNIHKSNRDRKRQICHRVKHLLDERAKQKKRLKDEIDDEDLDCDKAIVCFETQKEMEEVLYKLQNMKSKELRDNFYGQHLQVQKAARPKEIDWEYINVDEGTKFKRFIISWTIFILILAALTTGVYFLFNYKTNLVHHSDERDATIIVFASIFFIVIFNKFVVSQIVHALVEFQMKKTGMGYSFSFMIKYSLGLFFTTAIMTILVEGVTHDNVYQEHFGIVQEQTLFYFFTVVLVPLIWGINPWYIKRWIQRKMQEGSPFVTQEQANKIMEDPEYIMGKRYGELLQSFWFVFLYSCVIPIGSICVLIELFLFYWIDKYNLLRKSSINEGVSGQLCLKALFLLEFVLIIKPGGQLIFDALIRHEWNIIPVIEISIGALYLILPINKLMFSIHPERFNFTKMTYSQLKQQNMFSYELYNPLSKEEELKKYFDSIQGCSNEEHAHHDKQSLLMKTQTQQIYLIVRPHQSEKKQIDLFSQADFDTELRTSKRQSLADHHHHRRHLKRRESILPPIMHSNNARIQRTESNLPDQYRLLSIEITGNRVVPGEGKNVRYSESQTFI